MLKYKKKNEWIGFCSYRELWGSKKNIKDKNSIKSLLRKIPSEWSNYNSVIGRPLALKRPKILRKYLTLESVLNFNLICSMAMEISTKQ